MNLPLFSLPSNPSKKIVLRESTVSDALDFCDSDPNMEENLTTVFLNRVQVNDPVHGFLDAGKWTADDRRLGLFWYWLHTTEDPVSQFEYKCRHCGKVHSISYDMRKLGDGYRAIAGKAEREITFKGEQVLVRPLTGADVEALEAMRLSITPEMRQGGEARKITTRIRLTALMRSLWFSSTGIDEDRLEANEKKILALSMKELAQLSDMAAAKMQEMEHGLETVFDEDEGRIFLTIRVKCSEKGGETLLRVPFRSFINIPMV